MSSIHMAPWSQSKAQPAPVQPASVEEETFNFDKVSDISEEDDIPPAPAKARTAAANAPGDETTCLASIVVKLAVKSNRAIDIDFVLTVERANRLFANIASKTFI
jgi:hypothetical protein